MIHTHKYTQHKHTHARTHAESVTQAQYPALRKPFGGVVGLVTAAAVAVCAVVLDEICICKELSNLHKMSMIDHCILPSSSVALLARRKSKHFAFKILKYGEQCREVNWHLFGLFVCLVTLPNSHQATRQQRSDFSYTSEVKQRYNTACQNDTQVSCNDYIVFTASLSTLLLSSRQTHHRKLAAHRSLCALRT